MVFDLAESLYKSESGKEYTLKIKEGLIFHDKQPISIDDVIFTIQKIQDPLIKSPLQNRWEGIELEKIDQFTVKFKLLQPFSDFDKNLSIGILPKHIWENVTNDEFIFINYNTKPIGSGPYAVNKIRYKKSGISKSYILEKTKKGGAYISNIKLLFYENENDLVDAYRNGEINTAYGLTANQDNRNLFDNKFSTTDKLPRVFGMFFNQNNQPLLKDKNIRKLINLSINRDQIVDSVFAGYAYPINSPLGHRLELNKNEIPSLVTSIEKSGWSKNKDGIFEKIIDKKTQELLINISTPNVAELLLVADEIKIQLEQNGIKINIRPFDQGDLHQNIIRPRDYEILLFGYLIEKDTDLYAFWHSSQKADPGLNIALYSNSTVDRELEKLRKDKTLANLSIVEKNIVSDVPAVFIYSPAFTYLLPEKVKGEEIFAIEKQDRFTNIKNWYIYTRNVWNIFIKK